MTLDAVDRFGARHPRLWRGTWQYLSAQMSMVVTVAAVINVITGAWTSALLIFAVGVPVAVAVNVIAEHRKPPRDDSPYLRAFLVAADAATRAGQS